MSYTLKDLFHHCYVSLNACKTRLNTTLFWIGILTAFAAALVSCFPRIYYLPIWGKGILCFNSDLKPIYNTGWKPEIWFEGEKTLELCHAIIKQDVKEMQRLIDEGADVNNKGKEEMPLLLWAYPCGEQVFECLLKNGADPNVILESNYKAKGALIFPGNTLLIVAIRSSAGGDSRFRNYVDLLLKYGANPDLGEPSPLAYAVSFGYGRAFQSLIKAGADPNYNAGDDKYLIHAAIWNPQWLSILLEHGATYDINTLQGAKLQRYLYRAKTDPTEFFANSSYERRKGIQNVIDWLEERGVSFDEPAPLLPEEIEEKEEIEAQRQLAEKEAAYQSKLEYSSKRSEATLNWYQGEDETTFALCQAIVKRDVGEMQRLIDNGANVNAKGKMNFPLLWWACPLGEQPLECLLKNGADPNVFVEWDEETKRYFLPPCRGNTLLEVAIELAWDRAYENDVDLLLKYGAEPRFYAVSPFFFASVVRTPQSCRRFVEILELGADFDVNSAQGRELQRALWNLKNNLMNTNADYSNDVHKAIDWMKARGVSFDEPAPLLSEEIEKVEEERRLYREKNPPESPDDSETVNDAK